MTFYPIIHLDCQMRNGGSVKDILHDLICPLFSFFPFFFQMLSLKAARVNALAQELEKRVPIFIRMKQWNLAI
jgi:hypothetical protein